MQRLLTIFTLASASLALASQLALSQGPSERAQVRDGAADRAETPVSGISAPPVLRSLEPPESRIVTLPGTRVAKPLGPAKPVAPPPMPAAIVPAAAAPTVPATVPAKFSPAPLVPAPLAPALPPAPAIDTAAPAPKPLFPPALSNLSVQPPALPPAPSIDLAPPALSPPLSATPSLPPMSAQAEPRATAPAATNPDATNPDATTTGFQSESALFLQKQIGWWSLTDARALLGNPERQRPALDDNQAPNGQIYAFQDPTGRYKELELDFDAENGNLRTVFVYPWNMTWQECRREFGANVSATAANKGRIFYSYVNRKLDVLVAPGGLVISLGLY